MPHIHDLIDFTVAAFIIHKNKVLMIKHKKLHAWLPVGGHIELNEDPDEALVREVKEESGLDIQLLTSKPSHLKNAKSLYNPDYLNVHQISDTHKHIVLVYFAKSTTDKVTLAKEEHDDIRWFTLKELNNPIYGIFDDVKLYANEALKKVK